MARNQTPRNVGPDLQLILFDTRHQNLRIPGCFTCNDLNPEDIKMLSILQIVQELFEGTVYSKNIFKRLVLETCSFE